jgi:hypothetical protein
MISALMRRITEGIMKNNTRGSHKPELCQNDRITNVLRIEAILRQMKKTDVIDNDRLLIER